jgi:hypothetical protein
MSITGAPGAGAGGGGGASGLSPTMRVEGLVVLRLRVGFTAFCTACPSTEDRFATARVVARGPRVSIACAGVGGGASMQGCTAGSSKSATVARGALRQPPDETQIKTTTTRRTTDPIDRSVLIMPHSVPPVAIARQLP